MMNKNLISDAGIGNLFHWSEFILNSKYIRRASVLIEFSDKC